MSGRAAEGCTERWDDVVRHSCEKAQGHQGPHRCPCGAHGPLEG